MDSEDYTMMIKSKRLYERLYEQSRILELGRREAIPMATLRWEGVSDFVTMHQQEEIKK